MFKRILPLCVKTNKSLINRNLLNFKLLNQERLFINANEKNKKNVYYFLVSFGASAILIGFYDWNKNKNSSIIKAKFSEWDFNERKIKNLEKGSLIGNYLPANILDNIQISKKYDYKINLPGKKLILFQYTNCPFCCKVKTFLDYYGISHEVVEVNPLTRKQTKFSSYRKVPILLIEDENLKKTTNQIIQLNDSSAIISVLGTYLLCNKNKTETIETIIDKYETLQYSTPENKKVKEILNKYFLLYGEDLEHTMYKNIEQELMNERKWRKWTDEVLVHVLSPNIYRTVDEAIQAFNYFSSVSDWETIFSNFERNSVIYIGSYAMFLISKYIKKKYNLKKDIRQSLYDDCNYFLKSKGKNEFMGGTKPNLSDLSVFGILKSIEGCEAFKDLLNNTKISTWYFKMKNLVENHEGSNLLKNTS